MIKHIFKVFKYPIRDFIIHSFTFLYSPKSAWIHWSLSEVVGFQQFKLPAKINYNTIIIMIQL